MRNRTPGVSGTVNEWAGKETRWGSYSNVFPHFHLKYEPTEQLIFRGAFTTGISRPPWKNILPEAVIEPATRTITMSNTNLKPQYTQPAADRQSDEPPFRLRHPRLAVIASFYFDAIAQ